MKYKGELYGKLAGKYILCQQGTDYIDALEKDKARLDWLLKKQAEMDINCDVLITCSGSFLDTREAIDKAMEADK